MFGIGKLCGIAHYALAIFITILSIVLACRKFFSKQHFINPTKHKKETSRRQSIILLWHINGLYIHAKVGTFKLIEINQ